MLKKPSLIAQWVLLTPYQSISKHASTFTTQTASSHHSHTLGSLWMAMNAAIQRRSSACGLYRRTHVHLKLEFTVHLSHEMPLITLYKALHRAQQKPACVYFIIQLSRALTYSRQSDPTLAREKKRLVSFVLNRHHICGFYYG